jgi:alpha-beta hydrolase superfamily lysophospholipase
MFRSIGVILALALAVPAAAQVQPFPASFHPREIKTNGTRIFVRVGGRGPAVVLLHGYGETGDMWAPLAAALVHDHTVIVPDCAAWASPRIRPAATTRRPRAKTSPAFSTP